MPLPQYQQQVTSRPLRQQGVQVSTSPDTFGAQVGRSMDTLSKGLSDVATAMDYRDALEAEGKAREAFNGYTRAQREVLHNPDNGFLNRTGANSMDTRGELDQILTDMHGQYGADLSPRARQAYDIKVDEMRSQAAQQMITHVAGQTRNYLTSELQATSEGYMEAAITNWDNDDLFVRNLALAVNEMGDQAELEGWKTGPDGEPSELFTNKQVVMVSEAHTQRIARMAEGNPVAAQAYLDDFRGDLTSADEAKLDNVLAPLVLKQEADDFVRPFLTMSGTTSTTASISSAESNNNPNARNLNSTAVGANQMLKATFLEEVGRVKPAWAEGMSDDEILAQRENPAREAEINANLQSRAAATLTGRGLPTTPTNMYLTHVLGMGGGPAVAQAVMTNPNMLMKDLWKAFPTESWDAIVAANPQFSENMTVAQASSWAAGKMGDSAATQGVQFDAGAAYTAALAIEDPTLRDAVMARIEQTEATAQRIVSDTQQDASLSAWDNFIQNGVSDLSIDQQMAMGQASFLSFQSSVTAYTNGIDVSQPEVRDDLMRMSYDDPKAFSEVNLTEYFPHLSRADQTFMMNKQASTRAGLAGTAELNDPYNQDFAAAQARLKPQYLAWTGVATEGDLNKEARRKYQKFNRALEQHMLDFMEREGHTPNPIELNSIMELLTLPTAITIAGWADTEGSFFTQMGNDFVEGTYVDLEYKDISPIDRAHVSSLFNTMTGETPTADDIVTWQEYAIQARAGQPPLLTYEDIPETVLPHLLSEFPELSQNGVVDEAGLVETYQALLMDTIQGSTGL